MKKLLILIILLSSTFLSEAQNYTTTKTLSENEYYVLSSYDSITLVSRKLVLLTPTIYVGGLEGYKLEEGIHEQGNIKRIFSKTINTWKLKNTSIPFM